ncbi:DUF1302 family protein [Solimonas sp. K1W22B-7]|uniref:DUF1302 domain-containing protein n=1 Tax=Solimonas sp. K1W22B-7 TaxID=2303331 RepID=UPI000E332477|nr:DUF1302 family protein [Solimonas sp. K1W22B-7]AXQ31113.1 DUF1302 family protein [Solimonas sp. K1W22B-7]
MNQNPPQHPRKAVTLACLTLAVAVGAASVPAQALELELPTINGTQIEGVANFNITAGVGVRMQDRSSDLVGKANLNPEICGRGPDGRIYYQSCQGLFRTQTFPAEHLVQQPGQFSSNADDGNWNYGKGDLTQAPLKITPDLTLSWGDWGLFARAIAYYDFVNNDFREYHPNRITSDNIDRVGNVSRTGDELFNLPVPLPMLTVRTDSRPCPADRNPGGGPCGLVYGPGGVVRNKRSDGETLRQIGADFQMADFNVFGSIPLPGLDRELTIKLGRQGVNWGESTLLFFDSINSANPVNANNFFRVGQALEEVFSPVGMLFVGTTLFEGATIEGFYQYEWRGAEGQAPGSFFSTADLGTGNAVDFVTLGFGQVAEDPERIARLMDNSLSGVTSTSGAIERLADRTPRDSGQYGLALKYYADWLNEGTEFGLYFMNYHSRIPYVSFISAPESCSRHATNTVEFIAACADVPALHALLDPNNPLGATDDATHFDRSKVFLDYPEDIRMFGLSFNTTIGEWSVQGEVAYRPDAPLQVDLEDLGFASYGPALGLCHLPETGCSGSGQANLAGLLPNLPLPQNLPTGGWGTHADGTQGLYPDSDFVVDAQGTHGSFNDTYDLIIGHYPSGGRFFPTFVMPYRGVTIGKNAPESYIRGWEYFDTYQFNLGGTYIMDASHAISSAINADQIVLLVETGATWVPGLPALDELQLEAPGTFLHASAGADGSGADRSRQACSTNQACSFGPDGLRFNPHQQDLDLYPDKLSYGYDLVALIKYESVLPGISLQPTLVWKHDVHGTAPGLAANFIEGRKIADALLEVRYKSNLAFNFGYTWFTGGGAANLLRDRDQARFFVKYSF